MRPFRFVRAFYFAGMLPLLGLACTGDLSWLWPVVLTVLFVSITALGASFIWWRFFIPSVNAGPRDDTRIALSFDDGPAGCTADILDILQQEAVPAAFFAIGHRVVADPETVRRWDAEGHLICNHSYSHSFGFDWKSTAAMTRELRDTNTAIEAITGRKPLLFRPPYGVTNPALARAVRRCRMTSVGWSLRSLDTRARNPRELTRRILSKVRGGDVILLHDTVPVTAAVLTAVIRACREKGFTFVRLDELLRLKPYA